MDPASASVAFIGVAASLTTLATLVIDSSKTLYNVPRKVKKAPKDIKDLVRQLKAFECLLLEAQERIQVHRAEYFAPGVGTLFTTAVEHMLADLRDFEDAVLKLRGLLSAPASPRDSPLLRIRHILQEDGVQEYQRLISFHMATLTLLLEVLTSRKLHEVSQQTNEILAKNDAGFRIIHSHLASFCSSQNMLRALYQSKITEIEGRLGLLQGRLLVNDSLTPKTDSVMERVVAGGSQFPGAHRKSYIDLMLFGQVASGHNIADGNRSRRPSVYHSTFTFIPPLWLSQLVLHWDLWIQRSSSHFPKISFSLSPIRYNPSHELMNAITNFDTSELHRLFREGHAHPADYIVQRRPVSIFEVCSSYPSRDLPIQPLIQAFASRVDQPSGKALEMYRYLLKEGCGNSGPILATWHARVLIPFAKHSQSVLRDALDAFVAHGGNMFWQTSNRGTISSLLMRHGASFDGLSEYLFRQPEPWTVADLSQIDRWLVVVFEYADAKFRNALQSRLRMYRSGLKASHILPSINTVVSEVKSASTRDRIEFLKIISKWGSRDMILPFVGADIDLDEIQSNEQTPWLRLSYLSKAAKSGNLNTFQTLLDTGACPTTALLYLSRHPKNLSSCKDAASMTTMVLALAERAEPQHLEANGEKQLALLLRTDEVRRYCPVAADALIERFFLRRHNNFENESEKLLNSYILIALLLDLPRVLEHFHNTGSTLCGNQPIGKILGGQCLSIKGDVAGKYTWLTFAVHLGLVSCVKLLIDVGVDCSIPDPCCQTALGMAKRYVSGPHPRPATKLSVWPYQPPQRFVSAEDDQGVLAILELAANTRSALLSSSGHPGGRKSDNRESVQTDQLWLQTHNKRNANFLWIRLPTKVAVSFASNLPKLASLTRVIPQSWLIQKLWATAVRLSRLTFIEALILRAGVVLSLIALLLYRTAEFFWFEHIGSN